MAIAWALQRLRSFLIGIKFLIVTYCQCLINLNAWKTQNAQMARWVSAISEYDFEIKHQKGERMQHVDALSRAPVNDTVELEERGSILMISTREDEILVFERTDPKIFQKVKILQKLEKDRNVVEKNLVEGYVLKEGVFKNSMKDNENRELYVVSQAMKKALVIPYHDLGSHFGVEKTVKRLSEYYYFASMRRYVKEHIQNCFECILAKRKSGKLEGELHPIPPGRRPFDIIHMDHLGPFKTTPRQNKYMFGIIDNLAKYTYIVPVRDVSTRVTVIKVKEFIDRFGAPGRIISDRGNCFTSQNFKSMCDSYGIKHTLNSSRHPQVNGLIERMNQTLLPAMRASTNSEEQNDWDVGLKKLERDINSTFSKSTGKTPFESLYGFLPRFEDRKTREITEHCETYRFPTEIQNEIRENIIKEQVAYKKRYDAKRFEGIKYEIGDIVFVKKNPIATGESTKLQPIFGGPMVTTDVLPANTYRIKKVNEFNDRGFETTAHVSQLKIWRGTRDSEKDTEIDSDFSCEDEHENEIPEHDQVKQKNVSKEKHENGINLNNGKALENKIDESEKENQRSERIRKVPNKLLDYDCSSFK